MAALERIGLETALTALGELLDERGLHYEVVVIGGGNLILRNLVSRPATKDLDLLGEWVLGGVRRMRPLPQPFQDAITDVARAYGLAADWKGPPNRHVQDLRDLEPSLDELRTAARWTRTHDSSPGFRSSLVAMLVALGVEGADDDLS